MSGVLSIRVSSAFPSPDPTLAPLLALVDDSSIAQVNAFRRPQDTQRCLLGRLLPRYLLATELNLLWHSLAFSRTPLGRPFAIHPDLPASFDYNVSHDSDWVFLAWSKTARRVGIDVMKVRVPWEGETVDQFVAGLQDQLTNGEMAWLRDSGTSQDKLRRVFALWTLKEAYAKARGEGVRFDFQRVEFRFAGGGAAGWVVADIEAWVDGEKLSGWSVRLRELEEGYLVAIAEEGSSHEGASEAEVWRMEITLADIINAAAKQSST